MSVHIQSMVWFREFNTPAQKLVALCLADFCDDDGKCWPSNALVARKCGLSDVTVENAIAVFLACGLITREARIRDDGSRTSSLTRFDVATLEMESRAARKLAIAEAAMDKRCAQEGENEPQVLHRKSPQKPGGKKQGGVGEIQDPGGTNAKGGLEPSVNHQLPNPPFSPSRGGAIRKRQNEFAGKFKSSYAAMMDACGYVFTDVTDATTRSIWKSIRDISTVFNGTDEELAERIKEKAEALKEQSWVSSVTPELISRHWAKNI